MKTQTSSKIRTLLAGAALVTLVAIPPARADYSNTVVSQGPVGYYRLNETIQPSAATAAANSGGSLGVSAAGTYNSFPTKGLTGPFAGSSAVGVDGSVQTITSPYQAGLNPAQFTIEAWVNPASATVPGGLLCVASSMYSASPRQGWLIYQSDGTAAGAGGVGYYLRVYNTNGTAQSISLLAPQTPVPGTWTHLVYSFDGTTAKAFINGALVGSGVPTVNLAGLRFIPNTSAQYEIGARSDGGFAWPGQVAEVAYYGSAVADGNIANHYTVATTTPANYAATVQADAPLVYYRFQETDAPAANSSLAGSSLNGLFIYDAKAGVAGPATPTYPGLEAANKAAAFDNGGGVVRIPPLNLNTNTVTISCWVNLTNAQQVGAGIVLQGSGANASGLTIDQIYGGLGLGYIWNGNNYGVSPAVDLGLPSLPDSQWAYAALVIRPSQAEIYICDANNFANFTSVTNDFQVNHASQAFASPTLVGAAAGLTAPAGTLNGAVDEVTIFNRALGAGELYTQYAAAVGGVPPRMFNDLQGPAGDVAAGDPIVLTVDAGGTPDLTFTWHKSGSGTIAVTTNGVLTIASAVLGDAGTYDVTISNGLGSPANSQTVAVNVVTPSAPAITGIEGYKSRTLYLGATLRFQVFGTGGGLKYQWYKNAVAIPGATASVYSVGVTNTSQAGSFSVSVTNTVNTTTSGPPVVITIPTVTSNSYEGVMITAGPEAWWRMGEASGTNMFDGMGRHDGTYTNSAGAGPLPTLGAAGALVSDPDTAATFSSAGKGIGLAPYSPIFSSAKYSIEAWVKTTVADGQCPVSSSYGSSGSWMQSISGFWFGDCSAGYFGNNTQSGTNINELAAIVPSVWSHIVITYNPSANASFPFTLYVNGKTDGYIWGGVPPNSGGPFIIGGRGVDGATLVDRLFDGSVDEVAFYSRALSGTEATNHYVARGIVIIAPSFTTPFLSQTVITGKSISFSTTALGTGPIGLYWYKGVPQASAPIATGTSSITINPTALTDTGTYSLVASNQAGMTTNTASLTVISPVSYANVTNDLVLHLRFDGDTQDSSGKGNNGTPSSSPAPGFVSGKIGSQAAALASTLSGTSFSSASYVDLGTPSDLLFGSGTSFTVGMWIKLPVDALPGDVPFIGTEIGAANNDGWFFGPSYKAGGWQWNLNDGSNNFGVSSADNTINNGQWHNYVVTVDRVGAVVKSYLDGVLVSSSGITGLGSVDVGGQVVIGQDPSHTYPEATDFNLDDVGIWRRALTPLEVANLESAGSAGNSFDTVAPNVPSLSISTSGGNVVLTYSGGTLVESTDPTVTRDAWTPVGGASSPWTVTPSAVKKFYSVRQ